MVVDVARAANFSTKNKILPFNFLQSVILLLVCVRYRTIVIDIFCNFVWRLSSVNARRISGCKPDARHIADAVIAI
jgi:hypothetical protein